MTIQVGDTVMFNGGAVPEVIRHSQSDYPSHLIVGKTYVVEAVEYAPTFTNIRLENKQGKFNLKHFQVV